MKLCLDQLSLVIQCIWNQYWVIICLKGGDDSLRRSESWAECGAFQKEAQEWNRDSKGSPPGPLGWGWRGWSRDTHRGLRPVYHIFLESKKYQCASIKIILSVIFQEGFMGESEAGRPWCGNSSDTPEPVLSSHLLSFFLVSLGEETFPLSAFLLRKVFICFKGPGIICHELSKIMETKQEVKQGWWNQSLFGCHLSFLILLLELSSKQSLRRVCHG